MLKQKKIKNKNCNVNDLKGHDDPVMRLTK